MFTALVVCDFPSFRFPFFRKKVEFREGARERERVNPAHVFRKVVRAPPTTTFRPTIVFPKRRKNIKNDSFLLSAEVVNNNNKKRLFYYRKDIHLCRGFLRDRKKGRKIENSS
jgi:hypothetical protein